MTILERKAGRNLPKQKTPLHLHCVTLDKWAGFTLINPLGDFLDWTRHKIH